MTVQLSVTVWTIICFILLMIILHNLLFKPVLEVLDKRRQKIDASIKKKEEIEKIKSEYDIKIVENKKAFLENQAQKTKEEIEKIRINCKHAVEIAQEERIKMVDSYHLESEKEQLEILSVLENHSVSLANSFAKSIVGE